MSKLNVEQNLPSRDELPTPRIANEDLKVRKIILIFEMNVMPVGVFSDMFRTCFHSVVNNAFSLSLSD